MSTISSHIKGQKSPMLSANVSIWLVIHRIYWVNGPDPSHSPIQLASTKGQNWNLRGKSPKSKEMKANELCSASKNVALRVHSEKKRWFPPRLRPKTPLSARIISILRLWKVPISSQRVGKSNILHIRKWRKCGGSDFFFQKGACRNAGGTLPMSKYSHHVGKNGKIDDQSDIVTHLTGLVWYIIQVETQKEIN